MVKIGVTSQNKLKTQAVADAYNSISLPFTLTGYSANSGVGEQPVDDQTLLGARNRIIDVGSKVDDLDRIISIESGIFQVRPDVWLDKAVVVIFNTQNETEHIEYSDCVLFPTKYVEMARQIGFDTTTVGMVMAQEGYVKNHKDPHLSISGISREVYLRETVKKLVEQAELGK